MAKLLRIQIKRIYEPAAKEDGYRILVDRLWPRGITKVKAKLDEWDKNSAPSAELRKWFGHKAERFDAFTKLYKKELAKNKTELNRIKAIAKKQRVTLLYGAKNPLLNQAIVLCDVLNK